MIRRPSSWQELAPRFTPDRSPLKTFFPVSVIGTSTVSKCAEQGSAHFSLGAARRQTSPGTTNTNQATIGPMIAIKAL
ncbi:hypothetical protein GGE50_002869 [Rhizobium leguminosarum]|jgi:hypothetical protein|uniref:Uncharacterized protein n=1 Tax=Rhizobium leguminosarum bv. trifolii TaxID=386 RepID=A0A1C9HPG3_RHILT|nr:hypothetical protein [Rhizobium leguminosarum bv. trifolii]MBB4330475.1 hypothetical protein [Rhizobium leguminosarum]MBB4339660.1 hypothetical protein [Rhizobium leguminosarum]MBB4355655.1 hypothetical protein [Rhizobium leguminosarum]MBB4386032.1 hypothetical protein [Rhizobium leguminosarum]